MTEKELKARLEDEAARWARKMDEEVADRTRRDRHARSTEAMIWVGAILMVAAGAALLVILREVAR